MLELWPFFFAAGVRGGGVCVVLGGEMKKNTLDFFDLIFLPTLKTIKKKSHIFSPFIIRCVCSFVVVPPIFLYCQKIRYKKTDRRLLVLVICSKSPENAKLTFLKKLNFSRHAYKSTSNLTDGPTPKKIVVEKLTKRISLQLV